MKHFLLTFLGALLISFFASPALAQGVIGGGGGGLAPVSLKHPNHPVKSHCKEGDRKAFEERVQGDWVTTHRICKDGSFFEKKKIDYQNLRCAHGTTAIADDRKDGRIYRRHYRCIEGERVLVFEDSWEVE